MKLTSAQVEKAMDQFEAQAIPDSHPVVPQLNELFGDHTFLLDRHGLNILEPATDAVTSGGKAAQVVNLANWTDSNRTGLAPHEPAPTGTVIELEVTH
ncbi:hypothetical protein [Bradyrhizobium prioriisuperbiae]|uniref:hypothetical protein n=1 Tax=Bradyrhizobium prioriisuperbiae TaxID=2854389 RepID=UPI0028E394C2|nr:hypothetical protein [Bradyrhizobium prioritasuperba]